MIKKQIDFFKQFISGERFSKIIDNSYQRTRYMTVVIENVFQSHNASAILRTCDCFGVQDIHIIENNNEYCIQPDVVMGADKWLSVNKYNSSENNTISTLNALKAKGYRIVATTPHTNDVELNDFDIDKGKFALVFGTEFTGLSADAVSCADEFLKIPMVGFTESFNVSVSAAIILHHLWHKIRMSAIDWRLSESELQTLRLAWIKHSVTKSELLEKEFFRREKNLSVV